MLAASVEGSDARGSGPPGPAAAPPGRPPPPPRSGSECSRSVTTWCSSGWGSCRNQILLRLNRCLHLRKTF